MNVPDNYDMFLARDREQARRLKRRPVCPICDRPIQDDYGYDIGVGGTVCEDCARDWLEEQKVAIVDD